MNVLIVHAHPEPRSFTSALRDVAVAEFTARGDRVEVSDLYAMGFDPVARAADFSRRRNPEYLVYALEQRHAWESQTLAPDITAELAKVLQAELLILSFPLFWFSVPAMLKGWIDRVLISGVCYGGRRFYDGGGLRGKRMLAAFTLGGPEHMFGTAAIHGEILGMLRPLLQGTFAYVGYNVLPPYIAWHVPYVDQDTRSGYLQDYRRYLGALESLAPLDFPLLHRYDERYQLRAPGTVDQACARS
jgi:NAD(P)H dehydrogenase (quinone)